MKPRPASTYSMSYDSLKTGSDAENSASEFFQKNGFEILEKNFRFGRYGEIDIIARKGDLILFVEVKSRKTDRFGGAIRSISQKKKKSLKATARHFLVMNPFFNSRDFSLRFDMISIENDSLEWIQDIFR